MGLQRMWYAVAVILLCGLMGGSGRAATGGSLAAVPPPRGLAAEVEQLRQQPVTLAATAPHGTLPGSSGVDANGQARYTVPLAVAPSVRGMTPRLAIDYQSNRGNGLLGVGFALTGTSAITRCPHTIAQDGAYRPVTFTPDDALCLDGERLLLAGGSQGLPGSEYRPRRDLSRKVVLHGNLDTAAAYFEVFTADGRILRYGSPAHAQLYHWPLLQERDRYENRIDYAWQGSPPPLLPQLKHIAYGEPGSPSNRRRVVFVYESREDQPSGYFYGHPDHLWQRLSRLDVFGPGNSLPHRYRFTYTQDTLSGRSLLASLQQCDSNDHCLPPTVFTWQPRSADLVEDFDPTPGGGGESRGSRNPVIVGQCAPDAGR